MNNLLYKTKKYWESDVSFISLLVMLLVIVFVLPVLNEIQLGNSFLLNAMFIVLFFIGIFSARDRVFVISSIIMVSLHLGLRIIRFGDFMYFSLVSLSTVGFGDVHPSNTLAKMLSSFLSVLGILYPAVVIAKLVSYASKKTSL